MYKLPETPKTAGKQLKRKILPVRLADFAGGKLHLNPPQASSPTPFFNVSCNDL